MNTRTQTLVDLETKFWQSMIDHDTDTATEMLGEPSLMVSSHGAMKFDRADFRKMAEQDSMVLTSFEFENMDVTFPTGTTAIVTYRVKQAMKPKGTTESLVQEMNDTSTWVRKGKQWQCVLHTETPVEASKPAH